MHMGRLRKHRRVGFNPEVTFFKPQGVPMTQLEEINLSADELESLRLTALQGLNQAEAALKLGVHQSTLHRTLVRAEAKIADALVNGKAVRLETQRTMILDE